MTIKGEVGMLPAQAQGPFRPKEDDNKNNPATRRKERSETTITMTIKNTLYRYAITLNNLGVQLLEKGEATEGMNTLREAVKVMYFLTASGPDEEELHAIETQAKAKIHSASIFLTSYRTSPDRVAMELKVVCWDDLQTSSDLSFVPATFGRVSRVAFYLSDFVDDNMHSCDANFDSSVILYNYALAVMALRDERNDVELNHEALLLFKMSFHLLFEMIQKSLIDDVWYLDTPLDRVTWLTIAVVKNLIHTLLLVNREEEARDCQQNLIYIVQAMSAADDYLCHSLSTVSAAAAA